MREFVDRRQNESGFRDPDFAPAIKSARIFASLIRKSGWCSVKINL